MTFSLAGWWETKGVAQEAGTKVQGPPGIEIPAYCVEGLRAETECPRRGAARNDVPVGGVVGNRCVGAATEQGG